MNSGETEIKQRGVWNCKKSGTAWAALCSDAYSERGGGGPHPSQDFKKGNKREKRKNWHNYDFFFQILGTFLYPGVDGG